MSPQSRVKLSFCSNPRSPRRTIAINGQKSKGDGDKVPILDRPEERSQSKDISEYNETPQVPILDRPEERSQYPIGRLSRSFLHVPILDRPEERSQYLTSTSITDDRCSSNPRSPRRTIAIWTRFQRRKSLTVPILDRPEERSQLTYVTAIDREKIVPILDRPEERSQSHLALSRERETLFQSSIAPKNDRNDGCWVAG